MNEGIPRNMAKERSRLCSIAESLESLRKVPNGLFRDLFAHNGADGDNLSVKQPKGSRGLTCTIAIFEGGF